MSNYRAIIVDDEQSARNILSSLIKSHCKEIQIVEFCENLEQAITAIDQYKPELVFLDIEMPNYSGYEIATFYDELNFEIIFVTAYDSYAVKAFELSAVDYLLKPIEIDRLKSAVQRFKQKSKSQLDAQKYKVLKESLHAQKAQKLIVQVAHGQKIIDLNDVIAIQASESYSDIHVKGGTTFTYSKNLKHFERLLDNNQNFIRTHKSWIINTNFMTSYSKSQCSIQMEQGITAKLSKYKKEEFELQVMS